jgi:hypothetical protein
MTEDERMAFEWALNPRTWNATVRCAHILALYIQRSFAPDPTVRNADGSIQRGPADDEDRRFNFTDTEQEESA